MIVKVLVEIKLGIDKTFTYNVPSTLIDDVIVGKRVLVPFGKQVIEGFIIEISNDNNREYELKDIIEVIDKEVVINEEMLELGNYMSKITFSSLISCYQTMLPSALKAKNGFKVNIKYISYIKLIDKSYIPTSDASKKILDLLNEKEEVIKKDVTNISVSAYNTLIKKGVIIEEKKEEYRDDLSYEKENNTVDLNLEQKACIDKVVDSLGKKETFLLHGVTGSGKTEVYMNIIEKVLNSNKEAIVLVPEISLTPQLINTFRKRFGFKIAYLHSRLSDGEKYDQWRRIERKEVSIVIGARSAIFAPFTNLGVIIVDEEHTTTYKQENNPRYNAIDLAIYRSKKHNCPVVLGSATPSLESYTKALCSEYTLITMKNRVNRNLPEVKLINMRDEIKKGNSLISEVLYSKIKDRLEKKEQTIILLNRRGYSTIISCHDCGYVYKCDNCDIPLTYHKSINKAKCHYCNMQININNKCPKCNSLNINQFGIGTEKLMEEIEKLFSEAKVLRMDVDTTSKKGSHEDIINKFSNKEYDILIGTSMISKGLDFKDVTLVGVINADSSLNIPDFRSAERTFQLLNQVAGRSGRNTKSGEVIIQGFNIDHYSMKDAANHDYLNFYNNEIAIRKLLKYPPFCNLAFIKISGKDLKLIETESNKIASFLRNKLNNLVILGPSMSNTPKINNTYNMQIILKYNNLKDVYKHLYYLDNHYKTTSKISVQIDINPLRM